MNEQSSEPKIIAIGHQKGGTGKTTTVCNLTASFARPENGLRVIVVDLDPQAAASIQLSEDELSTLGAYDVIVAGHVPKAAIQATKVKNCLLIPATERLVMSDLDAATRSISFDEVSTRLRENLRGADLIILDCPAGFGTISTMAMTIADLVVVPTPPLLFESRALTQTIEHVERLRRQARSRLAVVLTMIDHANPAHEEIAAEIRQEWRSVMVPVEVPRDPAVEAAILADEFIVDFAPESPSALAYRRLAVDLARRVGLDLPAVPDPQFQAPEAEPAPTDPPPPIQQGPVPEILRQPPEAPVRAERPDEIPSAFPAPRAPNGVSPTPTAAPLPIPEPVPAPMPEKQPPPVPAPAPAAQAPESPPPIPQATPAPTPTTAPATTVTPAPMPSASPPPAAAPAALGDNPPPSPAAPDSGLAGRLELSATEPAAPVGGDAPNQPATVEEAPGPDRRRPNLGSVFWKVVLLLAVMAIAAVATFIVLLDIGYLPWVLGIAFVLMIIIFPALLFRLL